MKEPVIPCIIIVGHARFRAGVKVSTVQGAIDRLADRYSKLDRLAWQIRNYRERLPTDLKDALENWQTLSPHKDAKP